MGSIRERAEEIKLASNVWLSDDMSFNCMGQGGLIGSCEGAKQGQRKPRSFGRHSNLMPYSHDACLCRRHSELRKGQRTSRKKGQEEVGGGGYMSVALQIARTTSSSLPAGRRNSLSAQLSTLQRFSVQIGDSINSTLSCHSNIVMPYIIFTEQLKMKLYP